jgi:protein arginine kinase activator
MPALGAAQPETEQQDGQPSAQQPARRDALVDEGGAEPVCPDASALNELRMELKKAVHQEDFERAAQLRDQLRAHGAGKRRRTTRGAPERR